MKKHFWSGSALALMACATTQMVNAADIQFRGFASFIGGTTTSSDESLYGYDDTLNFRHDSLMALQMDAKLDEKLKATMQIIARGEDSYDPVVEWAYMTYSVTDDLQVSAGRIRIPFYRYSDFIDVGYAYNWLSVPQTVYGFDFPGYDGLSAVYSKQFGSWDSTFQLIYGQFEGQTGNLDATMENLTGFNWTMTRDWLTLRAGYMRSKASIVIPQLNQLAAGVEALGGAVMQDFSGLADSIRAEGDVGDFYGLALGIDRNNILFDAEYIQYAVEDSMLAETDAYYLSLGYRIGKWVPLVTYSKSNSEPPEELLDRIPQGAENLPFGDATLGQTIAGAVALTEEETTLTDIALRYDFHHSAAFKIALTQSEDMAGEKNKLLRFGVDLVF